MWSRHCRRRSNYFANAVIVITSLIDHHQNDHYNHWSSIICKYIFLYYVPFLMSSRRSILLHSRFPLFLICITSLFYYQSLLSLITTLTIINIIYIHCNMNRIHINIQPFSFMSFSNLFTFIFPIKQFFSSNVNDFIMTLPELYFQSFIPANHISGTRDCGAFFEILRIPEHNGTFVWNDRNTNDSCRD